MKLQVSPGILQGNLLIPASKSAMQRACAAALIRKGKTILYNPGISADDKAALGIIQALGAEVVSHADHIEISSAGIKPVSDQIHVGESGLSVRLFTSLAALAEQPITITGEGSLLNRPMDFFDNVLPALGVAVDSKDGFLPLKVQGPLEPRNIEVDGSLSSQYLTGLLFAYSAAEAKDVTITVRNLASKPYIDLSLQMLDEMGLQVPVNKHYKQFVFKGPGALQPGKVYCSVESDWSSASFWLAAGAIHGDIHLNGLDAESVQGDKRMIQAIEAAGARTAWKDGHLGISCDELHPFTFDATDTPDLFPPLVALAACIKGTTVIMGVHRLQHKESDRGITLREEFGKLGVHIELAGDVMKIDGTAELNGAYTSSHHDHRIAMAIAIAASTAREPVEIEGAEAVNKSYPQFWQHLASLGGTIKEIA